MKGIKHLFTSNPITTDNNKSNKPKSFAILDGGLGTALENAGADLNKNLWSAHYIRTDPNLIRRIHREYYESGADIVITSSYQAGSCDMICRELSLDDEDDAMDVIRESVTLAVDARDDVIRSSSSSSSSGRHRPLVVAASIGPYGACLPGGEEYHGDYGKEPNATEFLRRWHEPRFRTLVNIDKTTSTTTTTATSTNNPNNTTTTTTGTTVDILAIETIPCLAEVAALLQLLKTTPSSRAWISVTCADRDHLRSGEKLVDFVTMVEDHDPEGMQVEAIGVNCTTRDDIPSIVRLLRSRTPGRILVVYPNNGDRYDASCRKWERGVVHRPEDFAEEVEGWVAVGGPMIVGGCCTTDQRFIKAISERLRGCGNSE